MKNNMKELSIYIHIPFCEQKCIYCAFVSYCVNNEIKNKYFQNLKREIQERKTDREISSIYIGGGTPSCVDAKYIKEILEEIYANYNLKKDIEITIECNPNSVDEEKLKVYKNIGINRISFGVQSLDNDTLKKLGRLHNKDQVVCAINNAKKVGFKNISVDLLLGLENQNIQDFEKQLQELIALDITHISAYMLEVEEGTKLFSMVENKEINLPIPEKTIEIYEKTVNFLKKNGFFRYEISNFSKIGYESKHNINYWKCNEYLGFGVAAYSYFEGYRFSNSINFNEYENKENLLYEKIDNRERIEELIMLGLRCKFGFDFNEIIKLGYDIFLNDNFKKYLDKNILIKEGNWIYLNPDYYGVSNSIICDILP